MPRTSKLTLVAGMILLASGVIGTGLTYREMKEENLFHARAGNLAINLVSESDWKLSTFTPYQTGAHLLYFALPNPKSAAPGKTTPAADNFSGLLEVKVTDPGGTILYYATLPSGKTAVKNRVNPEWILLDTLHISESIMHPWTLEAKVVSPNLTFEGANAELFIIPPQRYDIGSYLSSQILKLIGGGFAVLTGFGLIVLGGTLSRKVQTRYGLEK